MHNNFLESKNLIKNKYELNLKNHHFIGTENIFNL
jgi:hypothetical protein